MKKNEKKFIKLNDSYSHLSLGNIINIIKDESKNKTSAIQSEVFCALFDINYINESTVNNYCIGARSIGNDYKQIYINLKKKYNSDNKVFIKIIDNVLSIVEGSIYNIENINIINENEYFQSITNKLYNIAKNDFFVPTNFIKEINELIQDKKYYDAFNKMIIFAILDKKQPLFEEEKVKNVIETLLQNTNISAKELQDFLLLELNEGINFSHSIRRLAEQNNSFANYQIAVYAYRGDFEGTPDYIKAYEYFKKAADNNHPSAEWMIANMILKEKLGRPTKKMDEEAISYLEKSIKLGNIASLNTLGLCYLNGWGVTKNKTTAINYFKEACKANYAYAYNNLAKIYEKDNPEKSVLYLIKASELKESYACNKLGNYYYDKGNYQNAFYYYNEAINSIMNEKCLWAYYNLATKFYLKGNHEVNIKRDEDKAIKYLNISSNLIESLIALLYLYTQKYLNTHDNKLKDQITSIVKRIEEHQNFNETINNEINECLKNITTNKININEYLK